MIARIWHGRTRREQGDAYLAFLTQRAIPDDKSVAGIRSVQILHRVEGEECHFLTFTLWDGWEAIRAFAGDKVERAKYYPEDKDFLLEFEPTVVHYEVTQ